jgi:hypothetical protein
MEDHMRTKHGLYLGAATIALALALGAAPTSVSAQQSAPAVSIGATDIGGVVRGPNGPEAGVWVIAETTDLPTKMSKTVVTDDQGRYVIPDLPKANYVVWSRGYGLVDSAKTTSEPGKIVNITAVPAPNAAAAAEFYPAIYWYAMLNIPDKSMFPGTGANGNGMATNMKSQLQWLDQVKTNGCYGCHQLGNKATRVIPKELGTFKSSVEAWERRVQSGQAMVNMAAALGRQDVKVSLANFANWTDRIAAGELPFAKPERPQGVERNVVVTQWDWADPKAYLHDQVSTDKRKPTVNAYGKNYGATEESADYFPILDSQANRATTVKMPVRDADMESTKNNTMAPSAYWGDEAIWDSTVSAHSLMMDERSNVWFTSRVGKPENLSHGGACGFFQTPPGQVLGCPVHHPHGLGLVHRSNAQNEGAQHIRHVLFPAAGTAVVAVFVQGHLHAGVQFGLMKRLDDVSQGPGLFCALQCIAVRVRGEQVVRVH